MKILGYSACVLTLAMTGACATKRYPVATPLSPAAVALMNCDDLRRELIMAEDTEVQISETSEIDWRSGAAFLGDFGIGNAMAKNEASAAIQERKRGIRAAQIEKGCAS